MPRRNGKLWLMTGLLVALAGACMTYSVTSLARKDRGIRAHHAQHAKEGLACADCHAFDKGEAVFPGHDTCSACHEVDAELTPVKACEKCHTKEGYAIERYVKRVRDEVKFAHPVHLAKGIECAVCHADPDKSLLSTGSLKPFCMDCHGKTDPALNACETCHAVINKTVRPTERGGVRLAHDAPAIWERVHGRESRVDPKYCALCHDQEDDCEDCHRKTPPRDHTVAWRRDGHGLRAQWDIEKCSTCHEEDMCIKCHRNAAPRSHAAGWGSPANLHCATCHYPPAGEGCVTCHETVSHATAMPSPHDMGIFPPKCGRCHPGGLPNRAPHIMNGSARCAVCH